jgi:hypothetical protein
MAQAVACECAIVAPEFLAGHPMKPNINLPHGVREVRLPAGRGD